MPVRPLTRIAPVCRSAALSVLVGVAFGCSPAPVSEGPTEPLVIAVKADVTGFFPNPPSQNESYTFDINRSIFDGLAAMDPLLRLEPGLAESWSTPDDRTFVFNLRPGVLFSNARPLTADDVVASIEAALEQGWSVKDYLEPIESVRALDPQRVEIVTRKSSLYLLTRLPWSFVLPADTLHETPVPVIGTGPYRLERWDPGVRFEFSRNPHYWGPRPAFDRVQFVVVEDDAERVGLVERGEAHAADHPSLDALDRLRRRDDLSVLVRPGFRVLFLGLRLTDPPFDDPLVREAIDLAIDREELIEGVLHGYGSVATQLVPPAIVGHNPEIEATVVDRARARELLAAAGYGEGLQVALDGPVNRYVRDEAILNEVARQLALVGVDVEVRGRDKLEFFEAVFAGRSAFHLLGWASETGDAGDGLEFLAHTPVGDRLGRLNTTGLADPEIDGAIERANRATVAADRSVALREGLALVADRGTIVPLVVQTEAVVHSAAIEWEPPLNLSLRPADMRPAEVSPDDRIPSASPQ